jgi:hypothetical protein
MTNVTMYDSIYPANLPHGAAAYAGYVNGEWPTYDSLISDFPGAKYLSIDVFGNASLAHCLDVESGDANNDTVLPWFKRMKQAGVPVPVIYTSASNVQAVVNILMLEGGYTRQEFLIWSAHYTGEAHICAPEICGEPAADGTQWTDNGPDSCDVSELAGYFFPWTLGESAPTPPAPPAPEPLPAPAGLNSQVIVLSAQVNVSWDEVKGATSYTVHFVQENGVVAQTMMVNGTSVGVTGLTPGWTYIVQVWANGGPVAPPHAEITVTA